MATLRVVREACPGGPLSLSTSAAIEAADPERQLALIAGGSELPDLVTANQGEEGIVELCGLLREQGPRRSGIAQRPRRAGVD